jgi:holo-[acyl-carrier protein] synthase
VLNQTTAGVDLIRVDDISASIDRFGAAYLERVFTPEERDAAGSRPEALAGCFAGKEAVWKAIGPEQGSWTDIEVLGAGPSPKVRLHGPVARAAARAGLVHWSVSISHAGGLAAAVAVGRSAGPR